MSAHFSRNPLLKGDGMRLRMYARIDQLSTEKERKQDRFMYPHIRAELARIFASVPKE